MNILWLGSKRDHLIEYIESLGDSVKVTEEPITSKSPILDGIDFIISYGYRHIIRKKVIERFPQKIINLHISFLPWNRGASPNIWSFVDNTPKGVTIHYIDAGVDTGPILVQREVNIPADATLKTSYALLSEDIEQLLKKHWSEMRLGKLEAMPQQQSEGSFHHTKDFDKIESLLTNGWDTLVQDLIGKKN